MGRHGSVSLYLLQTGSMNYHRKVLFMLDDLRFVILRSFLYKTASQSDKANL